MTISYAYDAVTTQTVTIANGASLSDALNMQSNASTFCGLRMFAIVMPASWTTANLTFQASHDGGTTYNNVYDSAGTEVTVTAAASRFIVLDPATFAAVTNIKVRSGTSGTPVNQAAARTITLVLRAV